MVYYFHNSLLPPVVTEAITGAVASLGEAPGRSFDICYYGLPVWILRERSNARVNRVQVEAIMEAASPLPVISILPDAYEDSISYTDGMRRVERKIAAAEEALKKRDDIPVLELLRGSFPGVESSAEAREQLESDLKGRIQKGLERARKLTLVETRALEYATPFQAQDSHL